MPVPVKIVLGVMALWGTVYAIAALAGDFAVVAPPHSGHVTPSGMESFIIHLHAFNALAVFLIEAWIALGAAWLPVSQRVPAGAVPQPLAPGTAARIFTGAPVPPGADAVVMQERCSAEGDVVVVRHRPQRGEWIRRRGEDIARGSVILPRGRRLRPQDTGLAASVGLASLPVFRRLRVATFFTGNELVMPGEPLPQGAIYNSNRFTLTAAIGEELKPYLPNYSNHISVLFVNPKGLSKYVSGPFSAANFVPYGEFDDAQKLADQVQADWELALKSAQ